MNHRTIKRRTIKRHAFIMRPTQIIASLLIVILPSGFAPAETAADRPNVIIIYTDDHGYADLSCQGILDDIKTPHTDKLAAEGVRFTSGYCSAPQCRPSRAGLLTGRYQNRFGLEQNGDAALPWSERTVAERLSEAGYITGMCGKWHLDGSIGSNGEKPDGTPGPRGGRKQRKRPRGRAEKPGHAGHHGFAEHLCGSLRTYVATHDADGKDLGGITVHVDPGYRIDVQAKWASSFIDRHADGGKPFFLYVPFFAPHVPLDAPENYLARFPGEMPRRRRLALAMLSAVDDGVGLINSTLAKHGLTDNTLVFYISDNGAPLKIHKIDAPGGGPGWDGSLNDPLLGEKGMLTEGGIRVPFVAKWPGHLPEGLVYDSPVIAFDAVATALTAAGLELDDAIDGVDLVPALSGKHKTDPHEALYWRWVGQAAIRIGDWKYLMGDDRAYLFDLSKDATEKQNLIAKHPDRAKAMRKKLAAWSQELVDPGLGAPLSTAGKRYFDHYLDGKLAPAPASATSSTQAAQSKKKKPGSASANRSNAALHKVRDKNKDGHLTLDEFIGNPAKRNVPVLTKRFKGWDIDKDGKVTLEEMQGGE